MMSTELAVATAARNTCKLCAPLGACLAFRGVERTVPLLHGSQGCATYIRRYMISHFKEPIDIASSNFDEQAAVYGGEANLRLALENVIRQYHPEMVGVATTCLSETIGDDVRAHLRAVGRELGADGPALVHVATPSYAGTHTEGYQAAVKSIVETLAAPAEKHDRVNLIVGAVSPADLRMLKRMFRDMGLTATLLPDYSETLAAPAWSEYQILPAGGTPLREIREMSGARATIELGLGYHRERSAGQFLEEQFGVPSYRLPFPIGIQQSDWLWEVLAALANRPTQAEYVAARGRLIDAYVDNHKYVFGRRAVLYGEPEFVLAMAAFLTEIGMVPVVCATGSVDPQLRQRLVPVLGKAHTQVATLVGTDFVNLRAAAEQANAEIVIGSSKGYTLARDLKIPLVRVGFPIHDRVDGPRMLHLDYEGSQQLFDRLTNALLGAAQDESPIGYAYL
jgi:nitrogenase molybdenum-iron protein NifN